MVNDHSNSERGNPLPPHGLLFPISSKGFLYAPSHRQDSTYHGLCYTSRGALAGTRNSSMGPPHEGSIRRPIAPWANALTTELHHAPYIRRNPVNIFKKLNLNFTRIMRSVEHNRFFWFNFKTLTLKFHSTDRWYQNTFSITAHFKLATPEIGVK